MNSITILDKVDYSEVVHRFVDERGFIRVEPASEWRKYPWEQVRTFMHFYPIYVLPTKELIDYLGNLVRGFNAIEIGAGSGNIGRPLGIRMTDSYQQANKKMQMIYGALQQPVIHYPADVIKADAVTAFRRFKPNCVLGCYVTHKWVPGMATGNQWGVDFARLLSLVKRLILVGNLETHYENPIMQREHREISLDGLITRSDKPELNKIFIWNNE